jgi:hypothetical protein
MVIILNGLVSNILSQTLFRSGLFLHHSVGGVIWNNSTPDVPQLMLEYNVEHNYTGNQTVTMNIGESFFPPVRQFSDHYWDTWHAVFAGESIYPQDVDSLQSYIANNPIIVIKTGWGGTDVSGMGSPEDTLIIEDYDASGRTYYRHKWHWRSIIRVMQSYPDNFFVIWTGIPLLPGPGYDGTLAHRFCVWAKDTLAAGLDAPYGDFPSNVYVFDIFHLLADPNNQNWGMDEDYHVVGDNHPNEAGCDIVAPLFVEETFNAATLYEENYNLPVELSAFSATIIGSSVKLNWRTETEVNNYGFEVERKINNWEKIGFVQGNGNSNSPKSYSFLDKNLIGGTNFKYRLKQVDTDGQFEYSKEIEVDFNTITTYALEQNYPNPFNPITVIEFSLPEDVGNIKLSIYTTLGEKIAELIDTSLVAGIYQFQWNAKNVTTGMYIYELKTDNFVSAKKMVLIK